MSVHRALPLFLLKLHRNCSIAVSVLWLLKIPTAEVRQSFDVELSTSFQAPYVCLKARGARAAMWLQYQLISCEDNEKITTWCFLSSPQYFVFDFHVPPDVMFDKIIKLSVSRAKSAHCSTAKPTVTEISDFHLKLDFRAFCYIILCVNAEK